MTTIFSDGFESGDFSAWTTTDNSPTVVSTQVHHDTYAMQAVLGSWASANCRASKTITSASSVYTRCYVRMEDLFTGSGQKAIGPRHYYSGGAIAYVLVDCANGKWGIENNANSTSYYESGTSTINADQWYCIELYTLINSSTGQLKLWVDGNLKVDQTGINTGANNITGVSVNTYSQNAEGVTRTIYFDCVVVADAYIGLEGSSGEDLTVTGNLTVNGNATIDNTLNANTIEISGMMNSHASGSNPVAGSNAGMILDCYTPSHRDGLGIQSGGIWLKYDDSFNIYRDNGTTVLEAVHLDNAGNMKITGAYSSGVSGSAPVAGSSAGLILDCYTPSHRDGLGIQSGGIWLKYDNQFKICHDSGSTITDSLALDNFGNMTLAGSLFLPSSITPNEDPQNPQNPMYIINQIWHYTGGIWDPDGFLTDLGASFIRLKDTNPENTSPDAFKTVDLFNMVIPSGTSTHPYSSVLAVGSGVIIQRDLSVGGFVASNQGACILGYGLNKRYMPPMIWLEFSNDPVLNLKSGENPSGIANGAGDNLPSPLTDGELYYYTGAGNETFPNPNHLYEYSVGPPSDWIDMGPASDFSGYYDTLHILKSSNNYGTPFQSWIHNNLGNLKCANITCHGDRALTIDRYSQINWNTLAENDWDDLGSIRFNNTVDPSNVIGMEFKGTVHEFTIGQHQKLFPVIQMLYLDEDFEGGFLTSHEFYPNGDMYIWGDLHYNGSLINFDFMDDFAVLRAITTKVNENGQTVYDPNALKFLQSDKGLFSLGACIGWELSIQQKFLQEIDSLKMQIADLKSELATLKEG